jgi:hypothetical protein
MPTDKRSEALRAMHEAMSEKELHDDIVEFAESCGWIYAHVPDGLYKFAAIHRRFSALKGAKSLPDLIMLHAEMNRCIVAETKTERGSLSKGQKRWLELFSRIEGVETYLWRPRTMSEVYRILRERVDDTWKPQSRYPRS